MNQDLSIVSLVLQASLVVQLVMAGLLLAEDQGVEDPAAIALERDHPAAALAVMVLPSTPNVTPLALLKDSVLAVNEPLEPLAAIGCCVCVGTL